MIYTHPKNEFKAIQDYLQQVKQQIDLLALRKRINIADSWKALREMEINK